MKLFYYLRKLFIGLILRCPNCERGKMFTGLFTMRETCPYCNARFERKQGESVGGTLINLSFAELLSISGFFISEALFHPPLAFQLIFWVAFNILFVLLFYRHARGMWVAIAYLSGGVYPDPDDASDWKREE
ncbi:MAG: DUF983 domain-containing protein [Chloroflexota bacterium]